VNIEFYKVSRLKLTLFFIIKKRKEECMLKLPERCTEIFIRFQCKKLIYFKKKFFKFLIYNNYEKSNYKIYCNNNFIISNKN
jgi:hypothetical protein